MSIFSEFIDKVHSKITGRVPNTQWPDEFQTKIQNALKPLRSMHSTIGFYNEESLTSIFKSAQHDTLNPDPQYLNELCNYRRLYNFDNCMLRVSVKNNFKDVGANTALHLFISRGQKPDTFKVRGIFYDNFRRIDYDKHSSQSQDHPQYEIMDAIEFNNEVSLLAFLQDQAHKYQHQLPRISIPKDQRQPYFNLPSQ